MLFRSLPFNTAAALASATLCLALVSASPVRAADAPSLASRITIRASDGKETISRHIYGHFAEHLGHCIYGGIWVGESSPIPNVRGIRKDVVEALRALRIPVLRWPGGCFADEYHWRDGIGPRSERPTMVNTHWGGVTEDNAFGTHEFLDLCEQLDCDAYVCGNVGSGTVEEMADWVEYMSFDGKSPMADLRRKNGREKPWRLPFFGVGNESWGCGGNMRPEYYADLYRRFQTFVRNFSGNQIRKIACGPNGKDYEWIEVIMRQVGGRMWAVAPHYYCGSGEKSRSATRFEEVDWFGQLRRALEIDTILEKQKAIMDRHDPAKRVAIAFDEWGTWHAVEPGTNPGFLYQQNTIRDAMVASVTLNIFNRHADRVKMANIAQMVNVLQAMILTRDAQMVKTPTYHVFQLYAVHQDATLLPSSVEGGDYAFGEGKLPAISLSASRDAARKIHVSLSNLHPSASAKVEGILEGAKAGKISGQILTADSIQAHNTFEDPEAVRPEPFDDARATETGFALTLPAKSIVVLEIE